MTAPARPAADAALSPREAERWLLSLELFGMRFGLDRMRRLMTVLGSPQERFASVHVVGTNGKSSTVHLLAAILRREGLRTGAYLSPHLVSFSERIRVDDRDITPEDFGRAIGRARAATAKVDRTLGADDRVTQFEALTAGAYAELARHGVEAAVVEAGLGGRYDATNVLPSRVTVLTNVGLEHTRWLGPTVRDIAREKLAVLRPGTALVVGAGLHPDALEEARAAAAAARARLVVAPADPGVEPAALGAFQRRNLATAIAAAEAFLGRPPAREAVGAAAAQTLVPGRFELVGRKPDTVVDGAHNAEGAAALAESLPAFLAGRPLTAVVSILDDKDAAAMLARLLPLCERVVLTGNSNARALPPATLASLTRQLGGPEPLEEADPRRALATARELAGPGGVVLAAGSLYLLADLLRP